MTGVQKDRHRLTQQPPSVDHHVHGFSPLTFLFPRHSYFHTHFRRDWPSMHIETAGTAWSGLPDEEGPWEVLRGVFVNAIIEYFQPCSYIFRKMVFIFFRWLFYEGALYFHHAFTVQMIWMYFSHVPLWRPLLLKPGQLELQFERTQGRKTQDAPIVWVYQLIRKLVFASLVASSDPHQLACYKILPKIGFRSPP